MNFRIVKTGGRNYRESVDKGTARVKQHLNQVRIWFKGSGNAEGMLIIAKDDAPRLAYALLLASSTEETQVEFRFDETDKK